MTIEQSRRRTAHGSLLIQALCFLLKPRLPRLFRGAVVTLAPRAPMRCIQRSGAGTAEGI